MSVTKAQVVAECQDCGERFEGSIELEFYDIKSSTYGMAKGGLPAKCCEHHNEKRVWGEEEKKLPQHSEFVVTEGTKRLGTMRVATMTWENPFFVEDNEIAKAFMGDIRKFRRERGI